MLPIHLALVSLTTSVGFGDVSKVSAALQKQLTRDFAPIWTVEATIDAFARLEDVPLGYWTIMVVDTFDHGGQHKDRKNQPYALVAADPTWSLVASHEALEMLADPFGSKLVAGSSPDPTQGRVEFLVEVCDPCQDDRFGYTVNGVLVSEFYTPNYFDPVAGAGVRYSFTGAITRPREVLSGGYLTWREPTTGNWFQERVTDGSSGITNLGLIEPGTDGLRAAIDSLAPVGRRFANLSPDRPSLKDAGRRREWAERGAAAQARELKALLAEMGADPTPSTDVRPGHVRRRPGTRRAT
jgi:hypothetical protein